MNKWTKSISGDQETLVVTVALDSFIVCQIFLERKDFWAYRIFSAHGDLDSSRALFNSNAAYRDKEQVRRRCLRVLKQRLHGLHKEVHAELKAVSR